MKEKNRHIPDRSATGKKKRNTRADPEKAKAVILAETRSDSRSICQCRCPYCGRYFGLENKGLSEPKAVKYDCLCVRCGHAWKSKVAEPTKCPGCGALEWMSKPNKCRCLRCGHEWIRRGGSGRPAKCPGCGSKSWNSSDRKDNRPITPADTSEPVYCKWIRKGYEGGKGSIQIASETGIALFEVIRVLREKTGSQRPKL